MDPARHGGQHLRCSAPRYQRPRELWQRQPFLHYDYLGNLTYETALGNKSVDYKLNNLNQITSSSDDGWKTSTTYTYRIKLKL